MNDKSLIDFDNMWYNSLKNYLFKKIKKGQIRARNLLLQTNIYFNTPKD